MPHLRDAHVGNPDKMCSPLWHKRSRLQRQQQMQMHREYLENYKEYGGH